ncbi:MAG: XDD4 family exosortase-dependent surface protein [Phycisphaerales bacterium]
MKRCAAILGLLVSAGSASAGTITVTGSWGLLSASARFENMGGVLVVTLTNTSSADVLVPADILTAVFFDISTAPMLTPMMASLAPASVVHFGPNGGGNVGGEWAYAEGLSGAPLGATRGISSAGFGLFGNANFGGANLEGPTAVNGLNYGITSAGDDITTGNTPVTGALPLIQSSVVFALAGISAKFDPAASIRNVSFQYGTALTEPNVPEGRSVPLPAASAFGLAGLGIAAARRRRSRGI